MQNPTRPFTLANYIAVHLSLSGFSSNPLQDQALEEAHEAMKEKAVAIWQRCKAAIGFKP